MNPLLQEHLTAFAPLSSHGVLGTSWAAYHLSTGQSLVYNDRRYLAASTIKLPLLMHYASVRSQAEFATPYVWQAQDHVEDSPFFEKGHAGQTISWDTLAEWMMILSDNAATNLLIRALGMDALQAFMAQLPVPLNTTVLAREMMDLEARAAGRENWTSPVEMAQLMQALVQGQCLSPEATHWVMDILFRCEDPEKIPYLFKPPLEVANKPGELPGLRADVGYVHNGRFAQGVPPTQAVVIATFCDGIAEDNENACDLWQAELAQRIWRLLS